MKAIITGGIAIIVIAFGSSIILGEMGFAASEVYSGANVRLE